MSDTPDPVAEGPVVDVVPEPVAAPPVKRRRTVLPMVVGGILAAVLGFGLAQMVPHGWPLAEVSWTMPPTVARASARTGMT